MPAYFSTTDNALLIRLLISHIVADFFLQPTTWVVQKQVRKHKSPALYWHSGLAGLLAYGLSGLWSSWWLIIVVGGSHWLIDWVKAAYGKSQLAKHFLLDQLAHVCILLAVWIQATETWSLVGRFISVVLTDPGNLVVLAGYLLCTSPVSIMVGIATQRWRNELAADGTATDTLADAGRWIGIAERVIIFSLVLVGQYEAIGFLIAAKSLLRFKETDKAPKQSEYILVGTLLSYGIAIVLGIAVATAIN